MHQSRMYIVVSGLILSLSVSGCESVPNLSQVLNVPTKEDVLSAQDIADGLRQALEMGSERAVKTLGRRDGFLKSPLRIPLPDQLDQARDVAARFGLKALFDDMEVKLNRAGEAAVSKAQPLFVDAIRRLSFEDAVRIYQGPDDAATQYLKRTTAPQLRAAMRPVVEGSLSEVGALSAFMTLADSYNRLPLVTPIDADLTSHVLDHAVNAIFGQIASEEAAIRNQPGKRTTALLQRVFG